MFSIQDVLNEAAKRQAHVTLCVIEVGSLLICVCYCTACKYQTSNLMHACSLGPNMDAPLRQSDGIVHAFLFEHPAKILVKAFAG